MSIMLSAKELEQMRKSVAGLYPDVCNILSNSSASDNEGGTNDTRGTVTRNVPCRMDNIVTMGEQITDGSTRTFYRLELSMPYSVSINTSQLIEFDGTTYNVTGVNSVQSWDIEKTVTVERTA